MFKSYSMDLAGRQLTLETGKMAGLANGSVLVRYGDTVVIVNVTASKAPREGIDFFPLSVDYEERLYAGGKIPGSFMKREGKPSDKAILVSRAIDRPIRPLFPKDLRNDVCVNALVRSVDLHCSPEVAAQIGTSAALSISDIPFNGPTAAVSVGYVDGEIVINPTLEQRAKNRLNLTVAGTKDKVSMIEAGADQIPEDIMLEAIIKGHEEIKRIAEFIENIQKEIGKPKFEYKSADIDKEFYEIVEKYAKEKMYNALQEPDKATRENNISYPNESYGYGILNIKGAFEQLR
jgi:polyribonucleotide nucleotidyltransferase